MVFSFETATSPTRKSSILCSYFGTICLGDSVPHIDVDRNAVDPKKVGQSSANPSCLMLFVFLACYFHSCCFGQDMPAIVKADTLPGLVSLLGSPEFAVRESAMDELSHSDEKMLPELEQAFKRLTKEDLEAYVRLSGVIAKLKSDRNEKQIRGFLRSTDPNEASVFDGWKSFSRVSGPSRNAKVLFLRLLEKYPELVFNELKSKKESLDKAREIAATISQKLLDLIGYEIPDALAMLYCLNVADDMTDRSLERLSVGTFRTSPFSQFMLDPQARKSLERLMSGWSKRIEERQLDCLSLFLQSDYPQAREVALRLLESNEAKSDSFAFVRSMQAIYRYGNAADLPLVEKFLENATEYIAFQNQGNGNPLAAAEILSAEFRDIALLVSMHLAGDDYSSVFPQIQSHPLLGFREETLILPPKSEEFRTERIKKWKEQSVARRSPP